MVNIRYFMNPLKTGGPGNEANMYYDIHSGYKLSLKTSTHTWSQYKCTSLLGTHCV